MYETGMLKIHTSFEFSASSGADAAREQCGARQGESLQLALVPREFLPRTSPTCSLLPSREPTQYDCGSSPQPVTSLP